MYAVSDPIARSYVAATHFNASLAYPNAFGTKQPQMTMLKINVFGTQIGTPIGINGQTGFFCPFGPFFWSPNNSALRVSRTQRVSKRPK